MKYKVFTLLLALLGIVSFFVTAGAYEAESITGCQALLFALLGIGMFTPFAIEVERR